MPQHLKPFHIFSAVLWLAIRYYVKREVLEIGKLSAMALEIFHPVVTAHGALKMAGALNTPAAFRTALLAFH